MSAWAAYLGTWEGEGVVTVHGKEIGYKETIEMWQEGERPFLCYRQRTSNKAAGFPMHFESGFFRVLEAGRVELAVTQCTGVLELQGGTLGETAEGHVMDLQSTQVVNVSKVQEIHRKFTVKGDTMEYTVGLGLVGGGGVTPHLSAKLTRSASA